MMRQITIHVCWFLRPRNTIYYNDNGNVIYNCFTRLLCVVINESHYKPCRALTRLIMIFSWFRVVLLSSNILQLEPSTLPRCDAADVRVGYTDNGQGLHGGCPYCWTTPPVVISGTACHVEAPSYIKIFNHQFQCSKRDAFSTGNKRDNTIANQIRNKKKSEIDLLISKNSGKSYFFPFSCIRFWNVGFYFYFKGISSAGSRNTKLVVYGRPIVGYIYIPGTFALLWKISPGGATHKPFFRWRVKGAILWLWAFVFSLYFELSIFFMMSI